MNFEATDKYVSKHHSLLADGTEEKSISKVWKVAKPVLQILKALPIIPRKWRDAIEALILVLDAKGEDAES